jgi:hypothetical protein
MDRKYFKKKARSDKRKEFPEENCGAPHPLPQVHT